MVLLGQNRAPLVVDWELPGGIVEPLEPARLGAAREVREELGVDLQTRWPTPRRAVYPDLQACADDPAACGSELAELQAYILQCHG
jgi:8-oxo-dGTP pyrophosphatase MutT (NUDIX family)